MFVKKENQICLAVAFSGTSTGILNTNFSLFAINASPLLSAAQALWSAYCFPGLGCLLAKKQKHGSAALLLSAAQMHWNAALVTKIGLFASNAQINLTVAFNGTIALECLLFFGLSWPTVVRYQKKNKKKPNLSCCCFQRHNCTGIRNANLLA